MAEHSPLEDFLVGIGQRFKIAQAGHSKRMKGRSLQDIFESSIGAGFGAGTLKSIRGVPNIRLRLPNKGNPRQVADKPTNLEFPAPAHLNRSASLSEEGLRKNIGGKRPPDAELEALALRKQVTIKAKKSALKNRTRIFEITSKLDRLKRQGLSAKTSREAVALQKELRTATESLTGKKIAVIKGLDPDSSIAKSAIKSSNSLLHNIPENLFNRMKVIGNKAAKQEKLGKAVDDIEISSGPDKDVIEIIRKGKVIASKTFDKNSTKEAIKFLEEHISKFER